VNKNKVSNKNNKAIKPKRMPVSKDEAIRQTEKQTHSQLQTHKKAGQILFQ